MKGLVSTIDIRPHSYNFLNTLRVVSIYGPYQYEGLMEVMMGRHFVAHPAI